MQRIGPRAFIACQVLAGTSGLASSSCGGELRSEDGVPPSATCESTSRAPVLDAGSDERIAIDGMDDNVSVVDVDAHGSGTDFVGSLRLSHGAGTLELGCEALPVAVYESYEASGTLRFQAIAVKTDRLYTLEFECQQERLSFIALDSTDGAEHAPEVLAGSCRKGTFRAASDVVFPALDMPFPSTLHGYTIDGPYVSLASDGRGRIALDAGSYELFVFAETRCSENCDLDDWRMLDTLAWDRVGRRLAVGVIELRQQGHITFISRVRLPGLRGRIETSMRFGTYTVP